MSTARPRRSSAGRSPRNFAFQIRRWRSKSRKDETGSRSIPARAASSRIARKASTAAACSMQRGDVRSTIWPLSRPVSCSASKQAMLPHREGPPVTPPGLPGPTLATVVGQRMMAESAQTGLSKLNGGRCSSIAMSAMRPTFRTRALVMATFASALLLIVLIMLAALDLRLDIAADKALVEQIATSDEPRLTGEFAAALDKRRGSDFERRLVLLGGGGLLLLGLAFALAWRFARRVEGPIEDLRTAVDQLAGGDWATRIEMPAGRLCRGARPRSRAAAPESQRPCGHRPRTRHHARQHERRRVRDFAGWPDQARQRGGVAAARLVADGAAGPRTRLRDLRPGPHEFQHRAGRQRHARADRQDEERADDPRVTVGLGHRGGGSALPGLHLRRAQYHRAQARRAPDPVPRALRHADQDPESPAVPALAAAGDCARAPERPGDSRSST